MISSEKYWHVNCSIDIMSNTIIADSRILAKEEEK
jgi:hypothetical protein